MCSKDKEASRGERESRRVDKLMNKDRLID